MEIVNLVELMNKLNNMQERVNERNTIDLVPSTPRQLEFNMINTREEETEEIKPFKLIDFSPAKVKVKKKEEGVRVKIKNALKTLPLEKGFHIPDTVLPNNLVQNLVLKFDRTIFKELGETRKFGTRYDKKTKSTIAFRKV